MSRLIRALQAAAIFLPVLASGINLAASILLVPRLLESPTPLMLRQWAKNMAFSRVLFPATLYPTAAALYLLAWHFRGGDVRGRLYLAAGLLCSGVGPYTWMVVMPTNRRILGKAEAMKDVALTEEVVEVDGPGREASARWLVDHWGMLNLPRAFMMGLAGALGLVAAV